MVENDVLPSSKLLFSATSLLFQKLDFKLNINVCTVSVYSVYTETAVKLSWMHLLTLRTGKIFNVFN